jgi:hypothetical protein
MNKSLIKKEAFIIGLIILAILTISFTYLDFGLFTAESSANSKAEAFSSMNAELFSEGTLYLYIEGDPELEEYLIKELRMDLSNYNIKVFSNLKENFDAPVLAISMLDEELFYTPFYSKAKVNILSFYSSSGSTKYFREFVESNFRASDPVVIFNTTQGPQYLRKSEITIKDELTGVFSMKAQKRHLAEELSQKIASEI